ncbi:MAG: BrnT family toxin [Defluviitaleaceae bacterium]|nr:BrnT family toxin [Defluviitaleaceae bacterium]
MVEYSLDDLTFNWNEIKAAKNEEKHEVTFEEAATAFKDENAQIYDDEEHSEDGERFILLGYSKMSRLLMVCHCYRGEDEDIIRIISARKARKPERKKYEERG